jgi:SAM-dependent methyltransferase
MIKTIRTTRDVILSNLDNIRGVTLDLGAGTAKYKKFIVPHTSKYIAYDMFPGDNIDVVGDVLNVSLPSGTFDTIISTQVLEHVEKPWVMVAEISRLLKTGGICILSAPFIIPFHADPNDYFRYTKNGLTSMFKNEGFDIITCESYGRTFSVLSEFIHFTYFNPYSGSKNKILKRLFSLIEKVLIRLDAFNNNKIIYPNCYIVAKKK